MSYSQINKRNCGAMDNDSTVDVEIWRENRENSAQVGMQVCGIDCLLAWGTLE